MNMFSVIFEILPNKESWDAYFDDAKMLRPELEQVEGYVLILISERETAPMRAEAPAKMPCQLIDCRAPL